AAKAREVVLIEEIADLDITKTEIAQNHEEAEADPEAAGEEGVASKFRGRFGDSESDGDEEDGSPEDILEHLEQNIATCCQKIRAGGGTNPDDVSSAASKLAGKRLEHELLQAIVKGISKRSLSQSCLLSHATVTGKVYSGIDTVALGHSGVIDDAKQLLVKKFHLTSCIGMIPAQFIRHPHVSDDFCIGSQIYLDLDCDNWGKLEIIAKTDSGPIGKLESRSVFAKNEIIERITMRKDYLLCGYWIGDVGHDGKHKAMLFIYERGDLHKESLRVFKHVKGYSRIHWGE
ncbi:hypothetical protein THAOC_03810, partial [Thalassiosira oceanica]